MFSLVIIVLTYFFSKPAEHIYEQIIFFSRHFWGSGCCIFNFLINHCSFFTGVRWNNMRVNRKYPNGFVKQWGWLINGRRSHPKPHHFTLVGLTDTMETNYAAEIHISFVFGESGRMACKMCYLNAFINDFAFAANFMSRPARWRRLLSWFVFHSLHFRVDEPCWPQSLAFSSGLEMISLVSKLTFI